MAKLELLGEKFGKLTVISINERRYRGYVYWNCQCDCGTICVVRSVYLKQGTTKSCGCLKKSWGPEYKGLYGSNIHLVWKNLMQRCYNKKDPRFPNYGGRGIEVCSEWHSFLNFYKDMKDGYKKGLTIDRIDNNEGYSKSNCRWVSMKVQSRNKSSNVFLTLNGETKIASDWARSLGIRKQKINNRLKAGWSVEQTLSERLYHRI